MTPSAVMTPGEVQLGDDLDDARAADPGDAGPGGVERVGEARLVRPGIDADDPEARLEGRRGRCGRARSRPARRAGRHVIWAPSNAGPVGLDAASSRSPFAEHDLGVRADVDDERHRLGLVRLLGEDHAGRVGADVAGDARQHVDPRARDGRGGRARRAVVRTAVSVGERERRRAERRRVDAEQQVMHDRVADDRELEDLGALDAGPVRERREQPVERLADRRGHLAVAALVHHHVARRGS